MTSQREPLKQIEIGSAPESWKMATIGEYCEILNGYAFKSADYVASDGILNFRVVNIEWDGSVSTESDCKYLPKTFADEYCEYLLSEGDILFVMVGATRGKLTQIPRRILPALMNQNMWRVAIRREGLLQDYLYYYLRRLVPTLLAETEDQARGFFKKSDFRAFPLPLPPHKEQAGIASVLATAQRAIERQERLISLTAELKKALMHKLFTEGTSGEPLKQTEIGRVPKSWDIVEFESFSVLQRGKDLPKAAFKLGTIPVIGATTTIGFHNTANVRGPGVTVVRSGSSAGKVLHIETDFWAHNVVLYVKHFRGNDPRFVYYKLCSIDLTRFKSGVAVPTLNRNTFRTINVAVPKLAEQRKIAAILDAVERRIQAAVQIRNVLSDGFRTLLQQLMTARVRVHDLDLSALNELAVEPAEVT
jgi:type I restriction enzyme, S subunit